VFWETHLASTLHLVQLLGLTRDRTAQGRLVFAWSVLGSRVGRTLWKRIPRLRVRIPLELGDGKRLVAVADRSELEVLREVFVRSEYSMPAVNEISTIVDLGSNVGFSVLYFRERFPQARIVAVEPDPDAFARLRENTADLDRIELINAAVADRSGSATLYQGAESWATSLTAGPDRERRLTVRTTTLAELGSGLSGTIDLLKLDIEGAEVPVLLSSGPMLARVRLLLFEYHREYTDMTVWQLLAQLPSFDIRRVAGSSDDHLTVLLENRHLQAASAVSGTNRG
jgi:FkbM family methyltransferase